MGHSLLLCLLVPLSSLKYHQAKVSKGPGKIVIGVDYPRGRSSLPSLSFTLHWVALTNMASSSSSILSNAATGSRHIVDWIQQIQPLLLSSLKSPTSQIATLSTATVITVILTVWYWKRMATEARKSAGGSTKGRVSNYLPVKYGRCPLHAVGSEKI